METQFRNPDLDYFYSAWSKWQKNKIIVIMKTIVEKEGKNNLKDVEDMLQYRTDLLLLELVKSIIQWTPEDLSIDYGAKTLFSINDDDEIQRVVTN